jgi:dUTP pyrophosphatase
MDISTLIDDEEKVEEIVPCAIIMPRSGLGCKGVKPRNTPGLIDADYQGEIIVCLYNEGNDSVHIQPMDRIAQLVFTLAIHPVMQQVQEFSNATERGANGFGSTGKQ